MEAEIRVGSSQTTLTRVLVFWPSYSVHLCKVNVGGRLVPTEAHLFVFTFDMALKTGSVIGRMALWDCIGGTSFDPLSCALF